MRYCPICGDTRSQQYLGKWGPDAVMRCGICGIEYYRDLDDPKQNDQFKKYCQGLSRIGYVRDVYPGDRVTIECIRRDD